MPHYEMPRKIYVKKHLNCGLRLEEQDQGDLQQFKRTETYLKNHFGGCRKVKTTSAPFKWNHEASVKAYTKCHRESFMIQILDSESNTENEANVSPSTSSSTTSPHIIALLHTDPVLNFLSSVRPSLIDFHNHFFKMGLIDNSVLNAFFSWTLNMKENIVRAQLGELMNPLQLYCLLVALHEQQNGSTASISQFFFKKHVEK
ncbi:hypothetical protein EDD16DRAFT_1518008 [Pisolithus croceorrhizus]|nr:hypothetical protein EDD16DRAFT_1518008 [Pisolithus croceorrhizus]